MMLPRMQAILAAALLLVGCQVRNESPTPESAARAEPAAASEETVAEADEDYWRRVTEMYEQAKSTGQTTADNASSWVSEVYAQAKAMGVEGTDGTREWVERMYHEAKSRGETTATSAKDWMTDDLQNIGAWEYKTVVLPADDPEAIQTALNEHGRDRWECFWVDKNDGLATFYMKKSGRSYLRSLPAKDFLRLLPLISIGGDTGAN